MSGGLMSGGRMSGGRLSGGLKSYDRYSRSQPRPVCIPRASPESFQSESRKPKLSY